MVNFAEKRPKKKKRSHISTHLLLLDGKLLTLLRTGYEQSYQQFLLKNNKIF